MKKKRGKVIELNISNKAFYSIVAVLAVLLIGVGVYAAQTTNPSVMGHTIGEISPPCLGILISDGTDNSWGCLDVPITCSGTDLGLQWDGNSWNCAAYGPECDWTGWQTVCNLPYWCQYDYTAPTEQCSSDPGQEFYTSRYCSNGVLTGQEKTVECCPNHGGDLCQYLPEA